MKKLAKNKKPVEAVNCQRSRGKTGPRYAIFSVKYPTFEEWFERHREPSEYNIRIRRLQAAYPRAPLSELRGHSRVKSGLSRFRPTPLLSRSWFSLSPKEKSDRIRALDILSESRRTGKPISDLSQERGMSIRTIIRCTDALKKVRGKWVPKKSDKISRVMKINEEGKEIQVEISRSKVASLIGRYQAAVRTYLYTGNAERLNEFRGKRFRDAKLKLHQFETNLQALVRINESREEPEFYEIYAEVGS